MTESSTRPDDRHAEQTNCRHPPSMERETRGDGVSREPEGTSGGDLDSATSNGRERAVERIDHPAQVVADPTERATPQQIVVTAVDESFRSTWNDVVERSPHGTPFHQYEFLEVIDRHADVEFQALVGWVDGEPVGVFPLFGWRPAGLFDVAFSPPPKVGLYSLGPATVDADATARTRRRNLAFVRACLERLRTQRSPWYVHVETSHRFEDVRQFAWSDYEVRPRYTYLVDLDRDEDDLFMAFSSDARKNVRECREADCTVRVGGSDEIARTVASVNDRYAEQGLSFSLDPALVTDLYYSLPDGQVRPYVVEVDGEFTGGMIAFEYDDTVYRWQGGTVPAVDLPVNDFLDWRIMQDAMARDVGQYDLVGANTERLCGYKAKFDPSLATYYHVTGGNRAFRAGVRFYERVTDRLGGVLRSD
ncbi:GNAT family N-acetyltransferase [Halobacteriales archaeon QS_1_68_20]|nr:MAG: GNAT family N-acetyltransferase [Halobacteriales archaeon QS_1_68_20]